MRRALTDQVQMILTMAEQGHSACVSAAATLLTQLQEEHASGATDALDCAMAAMSAASGILNYADDHQSIRAATLGTSIADWARALASHPQLDRNLEYNAANGRLISHQLQLQLQLTLQQQSHAPADAPEQETTPTELRPAQVRVNARMRDRDALREARLLLANVGYDKDVADTLRGTALCNLANTLDDSGRWVEAYQTYRDGLLADPSNGNASGNAAELLRRRIEANRGATGHYAAVHDELADHAVAHRDRTVELAGEAAARRWDKAPRFDGSGHRDHGGDPLDEYQQWIKTHRFALTSAVEGLGSDGAKWDSAGIDRLHVTGTELPPIYTSVNVLKAEYLVARRLAFTGEQRLLATPFGQASDDSGTYVDTLDMAVYGEASSSLVLAQRATLDLLDKIAVAINEHFAVGDNPSKVTFRSFWAKHNPPVIRDRIPLPADADTPTALALTELAHDAAPGGMYAAAQALRHAGTHRLVNLSWNKPKHESTDTHIPVEASELIDATHTSLAVARAAFLYLLDLVADGDAGGPDGRYLPLPVRMLD